MVQRIGLINKGYLRSRLHGPAHWSYQQGLSQVTPSWSSALVLSTSVISGHAFLRRIMVQRIGLINKGYLRSRLPATDHGPAHWSYQQGLSQVTPSCDGSWSSALVLSTRVISGHAFLRRIMVYIAHTSAMMNTNIGDGIL